MISIADFLQQSGSVSPSHDGTPREGGHIYDLLGDFILPDIMSPSSGNKSNPSISNIPLMPTISSQPSNASIAQSETYPMALIDTSDLLVPVVVKQVGPQANPSEPPMLPPNTTSLSVNDHIYPSLSPSVSPKPIGSTSAYASVARQPPASLQDQLRRTFKEFASGSITVDCGTAGIILENVLPQVSGEKLEQSFDSHVQRLHVKSTITEEMCLTLFVHVWNDCQ
jgi:hypothetical protein